MTRRPFFVLTLLASLVGCDGGAEALRPDAGERALDAGRRELDAAEGVTDVPEGSLEEDLCGAVRLLGSDAPGQFTGADEPLSERPAGVGPR